MPFTQEAKPSTNDDVPGRSATFLESTQSGIISKFTKSFMGGLITGLCIAQILIFSFTKISSFYKYNEASYNLKYDQDMSLNTLKTGNAHQVHDTKNTKMADELFNNVRVLCWVMTSPNNLKDRGRAINDTWGPRCNKLIFMSSVDDTEFGAVGLSVPEGKNKAWSNTKAAFKYIYEHHLNEYDWFMKASDETYVIVENLRKMLYEYSTEFPIYLGCKYKPIVKQGYMDDRGYVLSREALKRFVEKALPNGTKCREDIEGGEDTELGTCLENVEVLAGDSRDEHEHGRMFPFAPDHQLIDDPSHKDEWYWNKIFYKTEKGRDSCSDYAVSFHGISKTDMYEFDYCIYHLRPFGITPDPDVFPKKKSLDEIINALSIPSNNTNT